MYRSIRAKQRGFWNFVIPAVAAVAGSLLNKESREDTEAANRDAQTQFNYDQLAQQKEMNAANLAAQKEFAQHGVSWKVQDAKNAGLHPLFGAGLSGTTFSPSFQVANQLPPVRKESEDYSWLANLGQLMGNFFGRPEAVAAQQTYAQQTSGGQSVSITEHPGGGRTIVMPIQGLESQVSGVPLDAPMYNVALGEGYIPESKRGDPLAMPHIVKPGNDPFWQRFAFGEGFNVILPKTSEPQEVFEDKPLWFWAMVAKANVKQYGPGWLTQARQQFPSLREVWSGVVQELESSGILPSVRSNIPDIFRR